MTIRNPVEWGWDQLGAAAQSVASAGRAIGRVEQPRTVAPPAVRRIAVGDLAGVIAKGFADFGAYRTDLIFAGLIYPVVGIVLARVMASNDMIPLLFPLASGFLLIGPVAAVGLYDMSRRHERGEPVTWVAAFGAVRSPAFAALATLGAVLALIFVAWLFAAQAIYGLTLGPAPPVSLARFADDVLGTRAGWTLIAAGVSVGFLFAVLVLAIGAVSFPLLLDQDVALHTAVATSVRVVRANPGPMAAWGLIVAGGLVLGALPLFVGLIVVMPVLGHATWHLYRKTVGRDPAAARP